MRRSKAIAHARQIKHVHTLATVLAMTSLCNVYFQSDPALLLQDAEDLAELCTEHGFPYWAVTASWARGASLSKLGRPAEALTVLEEALSNLRAIGGVTGAPLILTSLAEAFGKLGRPIEGLKQLDEATRQIEATQERWTEFDMHRVRGELLIAIGDLVAAEASIRHGIVVARRQSAKLCELRASMRLARFSLDQRRPIDARDLLAPVYNWFSEGFDTPLLKEAQALLDELNRSVWRTLFLSVNSLGIVAVASAAVAQKNYPPGVTDTEIKIGQTMPYSGPASAWGTVGRAELAYFKMINDQGGVNGRKIILISHDDAFSPPKTVEQTRKLIEEDGVAFIFGTIGPGNLAIRKYLNDRRVPQLFVLAPLETYNDPRHFPWTMGLQPTFYLEGQIHARYILAHKPDAQNRSTRSE